MEVDVAVLGGGPGGYIAAIRAAQRGARVACIERAPELGGTCLRIGCIPTKAWVQTAFTLKQAEETFEKLGVRLDGLHLEFAKVNAWKAAVVKQMTQGVAFLFKTNSVEWIKGTGTFKDANTIGVEGSEGRELEVRNHRHGLLPAAHADPAARVGSLRRLRGTARAD
jgi:dihydrolipoamide dehydrogenase